MPQKAIHIRTRRRRVYPLRARPAQQEAQQGVPVPELPALASDHRASPLRRNQRRLKVHPIQTIVIAPVANHASGRNYTRLNPPPYHVASKKEEYWRFVEWSATFAPLRKPKLQAELAEQMGLDPARLTQWKWMKEFNDDVWNAVLKSQQAGPVNDAIQGWIARLPVEGRAADMKLLLQWLKGFKPTSRYEGNLNLESFIRERTKERMEGAPDFTVKPVGPDRKLML